jgi:endoglucanase
MRFRSAIFGYVILATLLWAQANSTREANVIARASSVTTEPDSIPPDSTDIRSLTSVELAREMIPGWNVGNSLEAIGGETAWGNPLISQRLIDSVKAAGFKAVRIPVAWSRFSDESTFTIESEWLDRVEDVVIYVLNRDMYAIINEHWDNGWIQPTYADSEYVSNRLAAMWKQIAIRFRDYGDKVLFAGTNEVMKEGDYGTPTKEYYTVQNSYNQIFVSTVRATGGRNYYRHLIVQGFNTNINYTVSYFTIPFDPTPNRLMVEVHYYDPYNFTINENSSVIRWGQNSGTTETWANEPWANTQFNKMKTNFIDKGYAVILGEYGAMSRLNLGSAALNAEHAEYRRYYINYITYALVQYGLVPFYWDNGYTGDHGMGIFTRSTGAQFCPELIEAIMKGVDSIIVPVGVAAEERSDLCVGFSLSQNHPNPFNPQTKITYHLPKAGAVTLKIYDLSGREVVTVCRNERQLAGWHELQFDGAHLPGGIYFYQVSGANFSATRKMLLLK